MPYDIEYIRESVGELKRQTQSWMPILKGTEKIICCAEMAGIDVSEIRGLRHTAIADLRIILRKIEFLEKDMLFADEWDEDDFHLFGERFIDFQEYVCYETDSFKNLSDKMDQILQQSREE